MQLAIPRFDLRLMLLRFLLSFLILTFCAARHDCAAFFAPSDQAFKPSYGLPFLLNFPLVPDSNKSMSARRNTTLLETKRAAKTPPDTATPKSERSAKVAADTSTLNTKQARMQDTVLAKADNTAKADSVAKPDSLAWRLRPELVALGAALLPGFGQIYNRAYWKLPIVYGLFAWFGYNYFSQQRQYLEFRQRYEEDLAKTPTPPSLEAHRRFREFYREQRDEFGVYILLVYLASIVDAYVDAHLFGFDISDDLSQRVPLPASTIPIFTIKLKF